MALIKMKRACALLVGKYQSSSTKQKAGVGAAAVVVLTVVYMLMRNPPYSADNLHLYRDIYWQERWASVERPAGLLPHQVPRTVHYLWCGQKQFRFQNYLSVLSAVRILRPSRVFFHYTHLPVLDKMWYNTWFQELKQSLAGLELIPLPSGQSCDSLHLLDTALTILSKSGGGVYVSETAVLTRYNFPFAADTPLWFSVVTSQNGMTSLSGITSQITSQSGVTSQSGATSQSGMTSHSDVVVTSSSGFSEAERKRYLHAIVNNQPSGDGIINGGGCVSIQEYNEAPANGDDKGHDEGHDQGHDEGHNQGHDGGHDKGHDQGHDKDAKRSSAPCVTVTDNVYPRDIWASNTSFATLARWLFYGHRQMLVPEPNSEARAIPRVGHVTWWSREGASRGSPFKFLNYLGVLSALHVAGMHHVYIHGDKEPTGRWWGELKRENVTFVVTDPPRTVFQQSVRTLAHRSDIARAQILFEHGGVYFDGDVIWAGPIPGWVLLYPTVLCVDWPHNGEWPESFNTGVLMSQAGAPWLRHYLQSLRYFLDRDHAFNAVMMSYRVYEKHPETVYIDTHLQVICFRGLCHPTWHEDYIREIDDLRPPRPFDWREGRAYHFTLPKPPTSLKSPEHLASGTDFEAKLGMQALQNAGRTDLLPGSGR